MACAALRLLIAMPGCWLKLATMVLVPYLSMENRFFHAPIYLSIDAKGFVIDTVVMLDIKNELKTKLEKSGKYFLLDFRIS
jgi:hypothetical protein